MKYRIVIAISVVFLSACGGGGGGGASEAPVDLPTAPAASVPREAQAPVPQGLYSGERPLTFTGDAMALMLEQDETWFFSERHSGQGTFAFKEQSVLPDRAARIEVDVYRSSSLLQVFRNPLQVSTAPHEFSLSAATTLFLPSREGDESIMQRLTPPRYVYEQPARVALLAGAWIGKQSSRTNWTVSGSVISAPEGPVFSSLGTTTCAATGTLQPHPNGRNVFVAEMQFTGVACSLSGQVMRGIGARYVRWPSMVGPTTVLDVGLKGADGAVFAEVRLERVRLPLPERVYLGNYAGEAADSTVAVYLRTGDVWVAGPSLGVQRGTFVRQGLHPVSGFPHYRSTDFRATPGAVTNQDLLAREDTSAFFSNGELRFPLIKTSGELQEIILGTAHEGRLDYNTPALPEDVAGAWNSSHEPARGGIWRVTGNTITAQRALILYRTQSRTEASTYCDVSGTVRTHPTAVNVLALELRYAGTGCALAGEVHEGVGVNYAARDTTGLQPTGFDASRMTFDLMATSALRTSSARVRLVRP